MSEKRVTIKQVALNNNCPECYSKDGLRLTFKQKFIETKFYKSITSEIKHDIDCKTCNSVIYPVQWTDDIERVVDYNKRAFTPKKASTHLKKRTWVTIIAIIATIAIALCYIFYPEL